ncbi:hypothetical protein [Saccharospirillum salsuginis]|uniref:Acetyltransferase n=1 Tax=Saccharospirillum salsuginis TaxID=418750 RepID=A0A918K5L4_9GAMM|nr:hypothetical protein [Saccharospirillum salsuginis]GGX49189.1 hypothetical protein GCM10007392_15590 [Saccharospirillum salsuginis]
MSNQHLESLANQIKQACLKAAQEGFEDAELSGLCREGCVEAALSAIEMVDIDQLLESNLEDTEGS